jgi:dCMP deaminase
MFNKKNDDERSPWDDVWIEVVKSISKRSYDPSLKVAAIVVTEDNTQLLSLGFNGNYAGGPNKRDSEIPGKSGFIHAEINCLIKMDYNNPKNKKMYLTHSPCIDCAKAIINSGIKEVIYEIEYRDISGIQLLKSVDINCRQHNL